jgi:hypothetical protein
MTWEHPNFCKMLGQSFSDGIHEPVLVLTGRGPWSRRASRIRPEGRAAGRRAFFDQHRDVLSKNPAEPVHPAQRAGRDRRGVLSLGHPFFAQAKKGDSLAAASERKELRQSVQSWIPAFAGMTEH